ncbi:heterokaryon incompatibility protein-domain-containing protein [Xylaria arbuscula]|nr:heterokaryon incompatibility protein-domain-containing protein [Xylaria arbuscula]
MIYRVGTTGDTHVEKRGPKSEQSGNNSLDRQSLELCDICRQINWHPILLDCCPDVQVEHSFPYRWADIPTFRQMEAQQHYCSFCRLCSAARQARASLLEPVLSDEALQLVWYVRNTEHGRHYRSSSKNWEEPRRSNIERMNAMGFRLFIIRAAFGPSTLHVNMNYVPSPLFQIMPAAEDVPQHRRWRCGQRIPDTAADPTLFRRWLHNCKAQHGTKCDAAYDGKYGKMQWSGLFTHLGLQFNFRLIDVLEGRVVEAPQGCSYIALSYVWGACTGVVRASRSHLKKTLEGETYLDIPNAGIPRTVQDAMRVTEMMQERFLWVDALCIVQDDAEELAATLGAMDAIYAAATLTIVAASGTDAGTGLYGALPSSRHANQPTEIIHGVTVMLEAQPLSDILAASCWRTRAWTYQEEYFSTRLLVFSEHHVYFRCRVHQKREDILKDDDVQSYFLDSGRTSGVWLRERNQGTSKMDCSGSVGRIYAEQHEQSYSRLRGDCHAGLQVAKRSGVDGTASYVSAFSDWKTTYRHWLEKTQHSGMQAIATDEETHLRGPHAPEFRPWSRVLNGQRRHSDAGPKRPCHGEGEPEKRIWWIDRRRSTGGLSKTTENNDISESNSFRFTVPEDSEEPFGRKRETLATWLTSGIDDVLGKRKRKPKNSQSDGRLYKEYVRAVVEYTRRYLTKQSDALNAIQGIMNHFERVMGARIFFGLPLDFFDEALLWKHCDDMFSDWFNPWRRYRDPQHRECTRLGRIPRDLYVYDLEGRKRREQEVRAQVGKGCIRSCDMYVDCGGLPTWSWCGWRGAVRYHTHGNMSAESELEGKIVWLWKPEYTPPPENLRRTPKEGILQVEAWIASIDLGLLRSLNRLDFFLGWPVEDGRRVRDGVVECILLSADVQCLYVHNGAVIYNIMIVGRDVLGDTVYRRGISQLFPEDWETFKPTKEWIALR